MMRCMRRGGRGKTRACRWTCVEKGRDENKDEDKEEEEDEEDEKAGEIFFFVASVCIYVSKLS